MKTNFVPALVTLMAGSIESVFALVHKYTLLEYLKQLLLVLILFYIIGSVFKVILDVGIKKMADPVQEESDENEEDSKEQEHDEEE